MGLASARGDHSLGFTSRSHPASAGADTASVVLFIEQEDTTAMLIGFTITGGKGTVWTDARDKTLYREGGGILCELSSPILLQQPTQ